MEDSDWSRLVKQLKDGRCTPFLGAGACHPTLLTGGELSEKLAVEYDYPFIDRTDLSRVAQYAATVDDRVTVKERVAEMIDEAGYPDFTSDDEPHALLAKLPLPVYLTTNYDDFMVSALEEAGGKLPRCAICRWWEVAPPDAQRAADHDHDPSADNPIVYHLHGSCTDVSSLVLTEDDYLDFLINLTVDHGNDGRILIPTSILDSLMEPLLFIGYSLQDWTFRVLFHGLLRTVAGSRHRRHVSVQLRPPLNSGNHRARAERYLNTYFRDWKVSVYWGTAHEFCTKLRDRLEWA